MVSRRNFIKTSTGMVTISGFGMASGTVSAEEEKNNESLTYQEKLRLTREVAQEGGVDEMERAMKELGMEYEIFEGKRTIYNENDDKIEQEDGNFSTQDRYSESESDLDIILNPGDRDSRVRVTVVMTLNGHKYRARQVTSVDDVIGIGFDNTSWTAVGTPIISAQDPHDIGWHSSSLDGGGLAGAVDLSFANDGNGPYLPEGKTILLETQLEHNGGAVGTIWGAYEHTRALPGTGSIEEVTGGGRISVTLSAGAATAWGDIGPVDAEPYL